MEGLTLCCKAVVNWWSPDRDKMFWEMAVFTGTQCRNKPVPPPLSEVPTEAPLDQRELSPAPAAPAPPVSLLHPALQENANIRPSATYPDKTQVSAALATGQTGEGHQAHMQSPVFSYLFSHRGFPAGCEGTGSAPLQPTPLLLQNVF